LQTRVQSALDALEFFTSDLGFVLGGVEIRLLHQPGLLLAEFAGNHGLDSFGTGGNANKEIFAVGLFLSCPPQWIYVLTVDGDSRHGVNKERDAREEKSGVPVDEFSECSYSLLCSADSSHTLCT